MKIGFDAKRAFLNNRGLGEYSRDLISCVDRDKHELFLFTPKIDEKINWNYNNKNCKIISPKYNNYLYQLYWRSKSVIKKIEKNKIDIYHGLSNELPYGIHRLNILKIVTIHDVTFRKHPTLFSALQRTIYDQKTKYACDTADIIIAVSEQTKKDIIKYYNVKKNKIQVIYQSCDDIFFKNCKTKINPKNNFYVIYVGAVEKRKNINIIIEALDNLSWKGNKIKLLIISPNTITRNKLHKNIKEKTHSIRDCKNLISLSWDAGNDEVNENGYIKIICRVEKKELHAMYQQSIALIQPSIDEGFGRPVLEALASKTNVIASNLEVFKEIGENNIKYFKNYKEIIKHIIKILNYDNYRYFNDKFHKKQELKCLSKFKYEIMKKNINELYK